MQEWVFTNNEDDTIRYTLGKLGKNNLICIGINPSRATPDKLDNTVTRVSRIAEIYGYDGWLMLNVYPQRDTYPTNIHLKKEKSIIEANKEEITKVLSQYNFKDVWAAWGTEIGRRPYLYECLKELHKCFDERYNWLHYGNLTKFGHPQHPSRMAYTEKLDTFDIIKYLNTKKWH